MGAQWRCHFELLLAYFPPPSLPFYCCCCWPRESLHDPLGGCASVSLFYSFCLRVRVDVPAETAAIPNPNACVLPSVKLSVSFSDETSWKRKSEAPLHRSYNKLGTSWLFCRSAKVWKTWRKFRVEIKKGTGANWAKVSVQFNDWVIRCATPLSTLLLRLAESLALSCNRLVHRDFFFLLETRMSGWTGDYSSATVYRRRLFFWFDFGHPTPQFSFVTVDDFSLRNGCPSNTYQLNCVCVCSFECPPKICVWRSIVLDFLATPCVHRENIGYIFSF